MSAQTDLDRRREYQRRYAQARRDRLAAAGLTSKGTSRIQRRRHSWANIVERAAEVVRSYGTGVTLRQTFYRLVSDGTLKNSVSDYQNLSARTAEARRAGWFPPFLDRTSEIQIPTSWDSPQELVDAAREQYRRDRTEGQEQQVWIVVEKAGLLAQFDAWFGDLGLPMAALSGYASQSDVDEIRRRVRRDGRPAVLLYAGDLDPSGEDIERDFVERTRCWSDVQRVALTPEQVDEYGLPELPGKTSDVRSAGFVARHGGLIQVEVDALDPDDLRDLFQDAVDALWDQSAYDDVVEREDREREAIVYVKPGDDGDPDGGAA
jgi:hypothetical protein